MSSNAAFPLSGLERPPISPEQTEPAMRDQVKIKLHSFLSGFFSAFDLSGHANEVRDRDTDISIYRHWRNVGNDIARAARKVESDLGYEEEAKNLHSQLRKWHECGRSKEFTALNYGDEKDDCVEQANRILANTDVTVKLDG